MALCFICLLKPSFYYSAFAYCPASVGCPHSSKVEKPFIRDSKPKRYVCYFSLALAAIFATMELYHRLDSNVFRDVQTVLSFSDFLMSFLVITWVVKLNFSWKQKLEELKVMLYIFEYLRKFDEAAGETKFYKSRYYISWCGALLGTTNSVSRFFTYVGDDIGGCAFLQYLNSFFLGYMASALFARLFMDTSMYLGFFRKIFVQINRELKLRLQSTRHVSLIRMSRPEPENGFASKMLKLRKLYLLILGSFRRSRLLWGGLVELATVGTYLQLIWLLFVCMLSFSGTVAFDFNRKIIFLRILCQVLFVCYWGSLCDRVEESVTEMESSFHRVPSAKLNNDELIELEAFIKLLSWEKPMRGPKTIVAFGVSLVFGMTVDIVVNAMVLVQLYLFLDRRIGD